MWYVYILECKNGDLYTGITNNIERRIEDHKQGNGGRFTKVFGVNRLLYKEEFNAKIEAVKREARIKGWTRKKKMALIQGDVVLLKKL
jgi:predicted GIY-YIG superfamily endonuclease